MSCLVASCGGITIDNIVSASGEVALRFPGGNAVYAAGGARLWAKGHVALDGIAPQVYPSAWWETLCRAGVVVDGVEIAARDPLERYEWLFYRADGSRRDLLFVPFAALAQAGFDLPAGWKERFRLTPHLRARLLTAVQDIHAHFSHATRPQVCTEAEVGRLGPHLRGAEAVHLAPSSYDMHLALASFLADGDHVVSLDPGHYMAYVSNEQLAQLLRNVTLFLPSEREVREHLGAAGSEQAARFFAALGPRIVVVKYGAAGCVVYDAAGDRFWTVPAYPASVVDPTGCGDAFCGGFLTGYLETGDPYRAAICGTVAASYALEGFGSDYLLSFDRGDAEARASHLESER